MANKLNTDLIFLKDILAAMADIESFLAKSTLAERMTAMAVAYEIAIIGEACSKLSKKLRSMHDDIPWDDIIAMRHRIIHHYGKVSVERLLEVVNTHLPIFKQQVLGIIKSISPGQ